MGVRKPSEEPVCPPEHSHGTNCYHRHACRCDSCRRANANATNKASKKRTARARKPEMLISARGTQRRLQALAVMGWSVQEIADRTGLSVSNLHQIRAGSLTGCRVRTYAIVRKEYEQIWDRKRSGRYAIWTSNYAKAHGYHGPLDWVDIDRDEGPID